MFSSHFVCFDDGNDKAEEGEKLIFSWTIEEETYDSIKAREMESGEEKEECLGLEL